jgi:microcin C transport system substrate-binding protein
MRTRAKAAIHPAQSSLRALALSFVAIAALTFSALQAFSQDIIKSHGYSFFGDLKYAEDYTHFDYVNPDAPKGGEISLWAPGTFDSLNPYSRKGRSGRYAWMMYESLLGEMPASGGAAPADVVGEAYGLLAHTVEYDEGKTWAIFYMRPEARFSNGDPVTAHDIVFSHNLFLEQGLPSYAEAVKKRVLSAEALDDHTVKFTFATGISRRSLVSQVGAVPAFSKKWYEETGNRLDEPRMEISPGSGPYMLDSFEVNQQIVYKRNPDYWAADLPINAGRHNFDTIRIEYFADDTAAFEAFKAGEYSFRAENNSKRWATGYDFNGINDGTIVRKELADGSPPTPSGIVFNLGKEPLQDKRVREAISLAYNFEWTNQQLQFGLFNQRHSFVQDTFLEAKGVPEGAELEFFQSLGDIVPEEIYTQPARMAHTSNADRLSDRRNLRSAMALLDDAGWVIGDDGKRRNAAGELLTLELPISTSSSGTLVSIVEAFMQNLDAMGISGEMQRVDPSQFTLRRRERDYDLLFGSYASFLGTGTGLMQRYGSEDAAVSLFNPAGLASPLVDAVINKSLESQSQEDEEISLTALDRVLRHEFFMIPTWYNDSFWVSHLDMYEHPENMPPYALGMLDFWWYNAEKAQVLRDKGVIR